MIEVSKSLDKVSLASVNVIVRLVSCLDTTPRVTREPVIAICTSECRGIIFNGAGGTVLSHGNQLTTASWTSHKLGFSR